jgi:hypothetical protein
MVVDGLAPRHGGNGSLWEHRSGSEIFSGQGLISDALQQPFEGCRRGLDRCAEVVVIPPSGGSTPDRRIQLRILKVWPDRADDLGNFLPLSQMAIGSTIMRHEPD